MTGALRINKNRLLSDLAELAQIGETPEGGVQRLALSSEDRAARDWFRGKAVDAGLIVSQDGAGNISAILPSDSSSARTIMVGSHLDTVPNGGRYDGALGVVAGLEVLRTIKEAGLKLHHHLEAIDFTDEEGTATGNGLVGSRAMAGMISEEDFVHPQSEEQAAFDIQLARTGITASEALAARRNPETIEAWIEVHVEQGPRLEQADIPIGVVTSIVGIYTYWLVFKGRAAHSGTTPLDGRHDALQGAALFVRRSRELVQDDFQDGVVTSGMIRVGPGAFNIVPEHVWLAVEVRHSDSMTLACMRKSILELAREVAVSEGLELEIESLDDHEPVKMHPDIINAVEEACKSLKLPFIQLPSYAGHDTQIMSKIARAGMFFVPSVGGVSHNPYELTRDEDCNNAGDVLLNAVLRLATVEESSTRHST